jgi:hypothetical protein
MEKRLITYRGCSVHHLNGGSVVDQKRIEFILAIYSLKLQAGHLDLSDILSII